MKKLIIAMVLLAPALALANEYWETVSAGKSSVELFIMEPKDSKVTAILLPGGPWALGKKDPVSQRPMGRNFLVRSAPLFYQQGITTVVMGKPGSRDLNDGVARTSRQHADDVMAVVQFAAEKFGKPVWLVGTSRGTQSAVAAALRDERKLIKGLVLSASMLGTEKSEVSILNLDLEKITVPVYISHHSKDQCYNTNPKDIDRLVKALSKNAQAVEVKLIEGGHSPSERTCGPVHWHGYINAEPETVDGIAVWVKSKN
jgi:pimeloyl-ACP methyl ester carboxylesterase